MYYGIDMGGSNMVWAEFDEQGEELVRQRLATPQQDYQALRQVIANWVQDADARWQTQGRLGIGFAGVCQADGKVWAANLLSIHGQYLAQDLTQDLQRPIFLNNDANCFLLSEAMGGAAAHAELALGLTLGTGVGGALTYQGKLINSARAGTGEFGHSSIGAKVWSRYPHLPLFKCGCGQEGCLETYISGTGLSNLYQYLIHQAENSSSLRVAGPEIIRAWQEGEELAGNCVAMYLDILASALAQLMTQLSPDIIVLGGGLSEQAWLYKEVASRIPHYLMNNTAPCPVVAAHFGGSGGVRGAALLSKCGR